MFLFACKKKTGESLFSKNDTIVSVSKVNTKDKTEKKEDIKTESFNSCNETFDEFFERFSRDSVFQKNRVKYPFKYLNSEYDFDKRQDTISAELILNKDKFSFIDFTEDKNAMDKEYDKYTVSMEDLQGIKNYRLNGYDNGIRITHKFKLIDGCWYMVEILDESI